MMSQSLSCLKAQDLDFQTPTPLSRLTVPQLDGKEFLVKLQSISSCLHLRVDKSFQQTRQSSEEHTEETRRERDTCTPMFIAALFIIARTWKQPRRPSADEWLRKLWYIYTMEYYSAIKKNTFESVLMRWIKLVLFESYSEQVYNSVGFFLFCFFLVQLEDCAAITIIQIPEHFYYPLKKLLISIANHSVSSPHSITCSVLMGLFTLDISYKWSHTIWSHCV